MIVVDNSEEEESDEEEKEIKRANWVERLMEIRRQWPNRQQLESVDREVRDEHENGVCDCDADESECEACYGSEDDEGGEVTYDSESFSLLLEKVPLSDTKLFSNLAFLCNMAYVIPEIKANKNYVLADGGDRDTATVTRYACVGCWHLSPPWLHATAHLAAAQHRNSQTTLPSKYLHPFLYHLLPL
ncbi:hypothetical protein QYF36_001402 [Acer negundo]|nr:hypothetical protein QYF36_001402 [Acer negundo]